MTDATLLTDGPRPAVRLERDLPDPPRIVWRALTEPDQLAAWFPCEVIVDGGRWVVGASVTFPFPPEVIDMTLTGEVTEVDEPRRLAFTWGEDALHFELSPHAGGTRLVLINELAPGGAARNAAGWDTCLDRLVGLEPPGHAWKERFQMYAARFEPVVGPQAGPPAKYGSLTNEEIARRGYAAALRGDMDAVAEFLDPDVRWHGGDPNAPRACRNRAEALTFMGQAAASRNIGELVDVRPAGDRVVVIMRPLTAPDEKPQLTANVTTFRDGRAVEIVHYARPQDALVAAGLATD